MLTRIVFAIAHLLRWFRPWEEQTDEALRDKLYQHFVDSLG